MSSQKVLKINKSIFNTVYKSAAKLLLSREWRFFYVD